MDPALLSGGALAALVFGFLAFQDRLVSLLLTATDGRTEETVDEP